MTFSAVENDYFERGMPPLKTGCCEQSDVVCFHRLMDQSEVEITTGGEEFRGRLGGEVGAVTRRRFGVNAEPGAPPASSLRASGEWVKTRHSVPRKPLRM